MSISVRYKRVGHGQYAVESAEMIKHPTKTQWATRLNWLDGVIAERGLPEHATLVSENLHAAWISDDLNRVSTLWDTFIMGNPAFY